MIFLSKLKRAEKAETMCPHLAVAKPFSQIHLTVTKLLS